LRGKEGDLPGSEKIERRLRKEVSEEKRES